MKRYGIYTLCLGILLVCSAHGANISKKSYATWMRNFMQAVDSKSLDSNRALNTYLMLEGAYYYDKALGADKPDGHFTQVTAHLHSNGLFFQKHDSVGDSFLLKLGKHLPALVPEPVPSLLTKPTPTMQQPTVNQPIVLQSAIDLAASNWKAIKKMLKDADDAMRADKPQKAIDLIPTALSLLEGKTKPFYQKNKTNAPMIEAFATAVDVEVESLPGVIDKIERDLKKIKTDATAALETELVEEQTTNWNRIQSMLAEARQAMDKSTDQYDPAGALSRVRQAQGLISAFKKHLINTSLLDEVAQEVELDRAKLLDKLALTEEQLQLIAENAPAQAVQVEAAIKESRKVKEALNQIAWELIQLDTWKATASEGELKNPRQAIKDRAQRVLSEIPTVRTFYQEHKGSKDGQDLLRKLENEYSKQHRLLSGGVSWEGFWTTVMDLLEGKMKTLNPEAT